MDWGTYQPGRLEMGYRDKIRDTIHILGYLRQRTDLVHDETLSRCPPRLLHCTRRQAGRLRSCDRTKLR